MNYEPEIRLLQLELNLILDRIDDGTATTDDLGRRMVIVEELKELKMLQARAIYEEDY